jgi:hypothetical protein
VPVTFAFGGGRGSPQIWRMEGSSGNLGSHLRDTVAPVFSLKTLRENRHS